MTLVILSKAKDLITYEQLAAITFSDVRRSFALLRMTGLLLIGGVGTAR